MAILPMIHEQSQRGYPSSLFELRWTSGPPYEKLAALPCGLVIIKRHFAFYVQRDLILNYAVIQLSFDFYRFLHCVLQNQNHVP